MFTLPWVSLKTISEPLLQPVFQIVRYVVKRKKSVISQTILYLKKVYVCVRTHAQMNTPLIVTEFVIPTQSSQVFSDSSCLHMN